MTDTEDFKRLYSRYKEETISGRYITNNHIEPLLKKLPKNFAINSLGESVLKKPIFGIQVGNGAKRILMWSQMHGNESTTTKALFDLFNTISSKEIEWLFQEYTLQIIPILNPDGAEAYTRVNANNIDLNRDAQRLSQPESLVLKRVFEDFRPHYCFNLHGQRTIFSAGIIEIPATVSFLAPAQDEACTITDNRKAAMSVIWRMNEMLQRLIPKGVGVYDDSFNLNCVGDTFQHHGIPTILFEAGHYPNDYQREKTREFIYMSYLKALHTIALSDSDMEDYKHYLNIPENQKLYFDIIIRQALIGDKIVDIAIQFQEKLTNGELKFIPKVEKIGKLDKMYAHKYLNANNRAVLTASGEVIYVGYENDIVLVNNELFALID